MNTLVSIITPSYNSSKFIENTIKSVFKQTYKEWEMIIIDDASSDNSNKIVKKYTQKDSRIRLITLKQNKGTAFARNVAIKEAKGRYIAFLDADDVWDLKKLEKQIKFMEDNNYQFTYSGYKLINEHNVNLRRTVNPPSKLSYIELLKTNHIGCLTVIYDSEVGKINIPLIKISDDYGLWLDLLKKVNYAYCFPEALATYRLRKHSLSSNKLNLLKGNYKIFREYERLSLFKSLYYLLCNILGKILIDLKSYISY